MTSQQVAPVERYVPWKDLRVLPPDRLPRPGSITFLRWPPRHLAWVTELDPMPGSVGAALDAVQAALAETYQLDPAVPNLPSLHREHRQVWQADHKHRVDQAVLDVLRAVRQAAERLYADAGERLAAAIEHRDDAAYADAAELAAHLRPALGHVEGTPVGEARTRRLSPGAREWTLGRVDRWYEDPEVFKPRITASWLADHPEVEPGNFTPAEVVANLTRLGAKRAG